MDSGFTSGQVVEFAGITARQLQWWDERGLVVPRRDGHRRLYSLENVAEIAVICELRRRGFSLQRVRKVVRFLQRELGKRLYETATGNAQVHLLTDGKNIFIKDSPTSIVDVLRNSQQPILAVCLSDTVQRIRAEIRIGDYKPMAVQPSVAGALDGDRQSKRTVTSETRVPRAGTPAARKLS